MLSQKQKAIINYLKDGEKKKAQIVNKYKSWYYANSSKHIGDILSRMVNAGTIKRVKKGVYSLNLHLEKTLVKGDKTEKGTNQISLF